MLFNKKRLLDMEIGPFKKIKKSNNYFLENFNL